MDNNNLKDAKMTVVRLWPRYNGTPPSRAPIISGLDPDKYRVIVVYLKKSSHAPNYFEEQGFKAYYISSKKFFRVFNFAAVWKIAKILKREKVDILHCHRHQACVYGALAAMFVKKVSVIAHVHGLNRSASWRRRLINSIALRRVSRVLTVGETVKEDVLSRNPCIDPKQVVSLGNSIAYEVFTNSQLGASEAKARLGFSMDDIVFGTVGRLSETKGCECLIDAFRDVREQLPNSRFIFVGDGRLRERLEIKVNELGCNDSISFLGKRDDVPEILPAMDAFVLASIAEGIPRALLEAMAAGVPCVATSVGGIPEILGENEYGFLVEPNNHKALAEAMLSLMKKDVLERQNLIEKSRQRVIDEFSHDVVRNRLEKVYQDVYREKKLSSKLTFMKYLKHHLDFVEIEDKDLPLDEISTQYNPDRFDKYKSVHEGVFDLVLKMSQSPHCRLLREYKEKGEQVWDSFSKSAYYRMQRKFGKSRKSAIAKAKRLVDLYESISKDGFTSRIMVLDKPIVANPFNSGYEIYEGHHRVACCIALGMKSLPVTVVKAVPKNGIKMSFCKYTGVTDLECADCVSYTHCKECEAKGDSSLRRCQRTVEKQYYSDITDKDVLEIGCGTKEKGGFIKAIVEANGCRWKGIDILPTDLATDVCSVEKMPYPNESFDYIIGSQTIEHWNKPDKALREVNRVLRLGGTMSLTAPVHLHGHKNFVSGNFDQVQTILLRNGFQIDRFETWRRKHNDLPVYHPNDYNKKYLRKSGIFVYDDVETYIVHFLLKKIS